jgi:hypothetical protein
LVIHRFETDNALFVEAWWRELRVPKRGGPNAVGSEFVACQFKTRGRLAADLKRQIGKRWYLFSTT